jgi:hypothetical protein
MKVQQLAARVEPAAAQEAVNRAAQPSEEVQKSLERLDSGALRAPQGPVCGLLWDPIGFSSAALG